ncbi:hypothetical protein BG842_18150 [Haladaptatus sp. W1]|uniref:HalOD1 output domain-containing protein n=1 Tax=Haladaptatus sp. W1 TaxID=1897478 RepID=UPI000849D83A|nr:HalOD1 output domain-containing protein [Haladaptatus sp. W1]ODR82235.1 hypothetical protein BG842_18150 [Haladaptatus sp. W1]
MSNSAKDVQRTQNLPTAIIREVADQTNSETTALEPLYNAIDPDALEMLFAAKPDGSLRAPGRIVFEYSGCEVTVTNKGDVQVVPLDGR